MGEGAGLREQQGRDRGGDALRRERLRELPHLSRLGLEQPRRAGPERRSARTARPPSSSPGTSPTRADFGNNVMPPYGKAAGGAFTEQQLAAGRRVPLRLQGPEQRRLSRRHRRASRRVGFAGMRVFLGITGASGALYARRLVEALADAGCEVGLCASGAAIEVLATELYGDARLSRDEALARLARGRARRRHRLRPGRLARARTPPGSAKVDAYVICPCSTGTLGTLASGGEPEPDPPRRVGRAQGGAQARALPARDAALADHAREHGHAAARRRDDPAARAGLLPRRRERRGARRLRRRARARPDRRRERRSPRGGARGGQ